MNVRKKGQDEQRATVAAPAPRQSPPASQPPPLSLQRTAGNAAVARMLKRSASADERLTGAPAPAGQRGRDGYAHGAPVQRAKTDTSEGETGTGERRKVLVVCDESGLGLVGVPVFNMELVKGLHHDHDVTLLTVDAHDDYDHAKTTTQHGGARVVNL